MIEVKLRRAVAPAIWDAFVENHDEGWFWHRNEWLDYCKEYDGADDYSCMIFEDWEPRALIPFLSRANDPIAQGGGSPMAVPLLSRSTRGLESQVRDRLRLLAASSKCTEIRYRTNPFLDLGCPAFMGIPFKENHSAVLDLTKSVETLRSALRQTYRNEIPKLLKKNVYQIPARRTDFWIQDMREIHRRSCGGVETRPEETWIRNGRWMRSDHAAAVLVRQPISNDPIGFVYTVIYKDRAYYACGASSVSSHGLQWEMIMLLKERGVKEYDMGWIDVSDCVTDKKGYDIEFFKRGFGGNKKGFRFYNIRPEGLL